MPAADIGKTTCMCERAFTGPRFIGAAAAALTAGSVVLTSCAVGDGGTSGVHETTTPPPAAAFEHDAQTPPPSTDRILPTGPKWLETDEIDGLGTFVVDGTGRAVYASSADTANESTCRGSCADTWLPLLASGDPAGGIGIQVSAARTVPRPDGSAQVAYQGHPLYWYAGDKGPGTIEGHGVNLFGAEWFLITPDGDRVGTANR
ncbi:COG4315 family predicted lipoprotein [Mycolicibacterium doricum]|nr:hypothetical protein [Mycolicibacterium doricum]MCV7266982.1 hypothetical protein [Mycolicibacterium doricum]